ncbi:MAG: 5-methylcytosine-specific restriction enzyme subunit McrC [Methylobacteriaceae bacterium]|nr:5-methylcytosine-specific restriction enzyme subunit McrC [Methylobacteriaceae bacterium]
MRLVDLHERESRTFPREELFDARNQSLILPETWSLSAIDLRETTAGVQLRALGLVGYLPLTANIVLNVRPKFPLSNLWEMLRVAEEAYERILPVLRLYHAQNVAVPHLLIARAFCHFLKDILTAGVSRGYHREKHHGYFKPKLNFSQTLSRFLSRGDDVNVASDVFSFSSRSHVNGILRAACADFLRLIPKDESWRSERALILDGLNALHTVRPERMTAHDLRLPPSVAFWIRPGYAGALTSYGLLLGLTKIGFGYHAQGAELPSFLFSLDDVFESFVRNSLRQSLRAIGISVLDGNNPRHQGRLFTDNSIFPVKPDLILRRGKTDVLGIGEVKYKPKLEESDRYQLISHVIATEAPRGVWISPAPSEAESGLHYVGRVGTGQQFYHYRLDLSGNLDVARSEMGDVLHTLLTRAP